MLKDLNFAFLKNNYKDLFIFRKLINNIPKHTQIKKEDITKKEKDKLIQENNTKNFKIFFNNIINSINKNLYKKILKKKTRKYINWHIVNLQQTKNNLFFNFSDIYGQTQIAASSGFNIKKNKFIRGRKKKKEENSNTSENLKKARDLYNYITFSKTFFGTFEHLCSQKRNNIIINLKRFDKILGRKMLKLLRHRFLILRHSRKKIITNIKIINVIYPTAHNGTRKAHRRRI